MRRISTDKIADNLYKMILKAETRLTPDAISALKSAKIKEKNKLSSFALKVMLDNSKIAAKTRLPVCQDTGMAVVMLEIGQEVYLTGRPIKEAINDAVKRAYGDGFFRKSVCDPITRANTGDNTPAVIYEEIVEGKNVTISFLPKGFGSENMSKIYMLNPSDGVDGIIEKIVETVKVAGGRPCPPVYVGVGIGGTFDRCAFLAKKALTRPIGTFSERDDIKGIEKIALDKINELYIGAGGFGGKTTAVGVSCIAEPTHIAGLPVAVNVQCHASRFIKKTI